MSASATVLSTTNKALSLAQRKQVKDNQESWDKQLNKIEAATGVSGWTYDFDGDIAAFAKAVNADKQEKVATILSGSYIEKIAVLFERQMKDAFIKEAILAALPTKQIFFRPLAAKIPGGVYQDAKIEDGKLFIGCVPEHFWSNMDHIEQIEFSTRLGATAAAVPDDIPALSEKNPTLTLQQRMHIKKNKENLEKQLKRIEAATGVSGWTYTFDGDLAAFAKSIDGADKQEKVGGILLGGYIEQIASLIEKSMKDEMIKEAFLETVNKKIVFRPLKVKPSGEFLYIKVSVDGDSLVFGCVPEHFWKNLDEISAHKMEKLL